MRKLAISALLLLIAVGCSNSACNERGAPPLLFPHASLVHG
ncbi:hypothetical protein SAMN04487965_2600 [Microbulbifer donghaiensis]|uniref:Lipoprotein n=1 Tax=Microbulbifer donghaiensis TaxID=494016 RepID=A0A1M5E6G7_9GAMM|nr:hypothetical protein [Microbulbifer donghaiensis]SHF74641.1 hypothetical protein SAMN04487965_2600 [Microbulbifer donghaiensis]